MNKNKFIADQPFSFNKSPASTALFISPHLDDVAFSCGGTLIKLADENCRTILCTVFTKSVPNPLGFALACQLDKGLSPEIDYMQLRRIEDAEFARIANVSQLIHLDFPEAPHRNYNSPSELFGGIHESDDIWVRVSLELEKIVEEFQTSVIFAPQGIGNHVDHLQTIRALLANKFSAPLFWYQDTPYIIRNPESHPSQLLPWNLTKKAIEVTGTIDRKIAGCCAYKSQIEFQFGGAQKLLSDLRQFHLKQNSVPHLNFVEYFLTN